MLTTLQPVSSVTTVTPENNHSETNQKNFLLFTIIQYATLVTSAYTGAIVDDSNLIQ